MINNLPAVDVFIYSYLVTSGLLLRGFSKDAFVVIPVILLVLLAACAEGLTLCG